MGTDRLGILAFVILLGLVAPTVPTAASAQEWPTRPVKVIVPLGPGSGTDVIGRLITDRLSARWNKPVVVENRPGGDGMIGIKAFLTAADDHVLLFTATSVFTGHPYLYDKLPYDPDDLVPAAQVNDTPVVVAVPTVLNASSMKEFVDMARARPNTLNAAAITGLQDLIFNGFLKAENLEMAKVPYRDTVQALNDLAENRIQILLTSVTIVQSQVQAGKIRIIATTSRQRQPVLPETPTVGEAGIPFPDCRGRVGFLPPKDHESADARSDHGRCDRGGQRRSDLARPACRYGPSVAHRALVRIPKARGRPTDSRRGRRTAPGHQARTAMSLALVEDAV